MSAGAKVVSQNNDLEFAIFEKEELNVCKLSILCGCFPGVLWARCVSGAQDAHCLH